MDAHRPPRLVAVDMDGTFLRSNNTYDRERFGRLFAAMRAAGCRFVVASGNQYYQLRSFFTDLPFDEVAYVAHNGAYVRVGDEVVSVAKLPESDARHVIDSLPADSSIAFLAAGPEGAYVPDTMSDWYYDRMATYHHRQQRVPSLDAVTDKVFAFGIERADGVTDEQAADLTARVGGVVRAVTSGHSSIDLLMPGCHKANGLQLLLHRWGIDPADAVAFGDSGNDVEMLRLVGRVYAMANAAEPVKAVAGHRAPANNDDGVLAVLEGWFG